MFWKYNFGSSAQIETLLQKENVTLSELMDEDELLQECKAQNRKLIDFLTRAEVLDELVYLVVNEPSADSELKMRFKYANLAAELLTADVPAIIDKLVASTSLLDVLYKFLKQEKPLNPLLASFFSKVLGMLVQRRSEQNWYSYQFTCFQVLDFLKSKGDFVELAVRHVGTSAIMDLLLRLICNVEEDEIRQSVHQWLNECRLVERLVGRLSPEADPDEHSSADNILCEISAACRDASSEGLPAANPLLATLESEETIDKMLDLLLHEERSESSLSHVINILLTLMSARSPLHFHPNLPNQYHQPHQPQQQPQQQPQHHQEQSLKESVEGEGASDCRRNVVARTIAKRLPNLHNILLHPPKKGLLVTAYGAEVEPLGSTRLQVVTLVAALVASNDPIVHTALYQLNTVQHLMDLFFKFMLNNFLHTQVEQLLTAILTHTPAPASPQGPPDHPLLTQLFTHCRIIQRIVAAYEETTESQDGKQIHNIRGYMGHLRQVANTIVQQAEFGPNEHRIKQLIQELPGDNATQWDDFVSNALAEVNRKNEITPLPGVVAEQFYVMLEEHQAMQIPGFKEMDMDVIGDFRYADDEFKDPDDNLSGPLQRLTTQALALSGQGGSPGGQGMEGGGEAGVGDHDLFEEMCSSRCPDPQLEDIWNEKEKQITFNHPPSERADDGAASSSDEEEEEDFTSLRTEETKMEVDQEEWRHLEARRAARPVESETLQPGVSSGTDWAEVFDKRGSSGEGGEGEGSNPWQSAPMSDTSDNSGWADFGSFSSSATSDPFGQPCPNKPSFAPDFSGVFGAAGRARQGPQGSQGPPAFPDNPPPSSNQEAFKADFSSVNFDTAFEAECDGQKPNNASTTPKDSQTSFLSSRGLMRNTKNEEGEGSSSEAGMADNHSLSRTQQNTGSQQQQQQQPQPQQQEEEEEKQQEQQTKQQEQQTKQQKNEEIEEGQPPAEPSTQS